ncbi:hypothetical protein C8F01DRAFT_1261417 [Mycena amicta]|nr:hypothetical protein C8F01DRAFT_1261417 [Mycena amicta]
MPRDKKPSYWTNHLRVVYDDTIPMSRRLTALGLQSGLSGVAGFALGTVCGAIPRAVEAVVTSRRRTNPIPPLRLIGLGALANGALLGIIGSTIGPATFLLHSCGMPIQKLELPPAFVH